MAYRVRKHDEHMAFALVAAWNAKQEAAVASFFHADITQISSGHFTAPVVASQIISAANSSSEGTAVTLSNQLLDYINNHFADTFAHNTAVSAAMTTARATDLASAITLGNAIKAAYNTHLSAANVHFNNDGTNTIAAANATDQTSVNTLLNELKTDFNAHIISAPTGAMIRLVAP